MRRVLLGLASGVLAAAIVVAAGCASLATPEAPSTATRQPRPCAKPMKCETRAASASVGPMGSPETTATQPTTQPTASSTLGNAKPNVDWDAPAAGQGIGKHLSGA